MNIFKLSNIVVRGILVVSLATSLGSCKNLFESMSSTDTDKALLFDAKMKINKKLWGLAIDVFPDMSAEFLATTEVQMLLAHAYAGRCGYDFLAWITIITDLGTSTDNFFLFLMKQASGITLAQVDDCISAEAIVMTEAVAPTDRSLDENLLMTFLSFYKVSAILALNADPDGDQIPTPGFDGCSVGDISDDHVKHIVTGVSIALESLNEVIASSSAIGAGSTDDIAAICTDPVLVAIAPTLCSNRAIADVDANELRSFRTIIYETDSIGLGTCTAVPTADLTNCLCP